MILSTRRLLLPLLGLAVLSGSSCAYRGITSRTHAPVASSPKVIARSHAKVLSASWGTDNAVGCPKGQQGLDNIPVTFNWFIRRSSIQTTDFQIERSDWSRITSLPTADVEPLAGGPFIVDAWTLTPAIYRGDRNRCTVGKTFVRVMWSNGLTAYPTGAEVGAPVVASYRARYKLPNGKIVAIAPAAVADLDDHSTSANADNMHDLCLPKLPRGATLRGVTIGAGLIQDPNGDPIPPRSHISSDRGAPPLRRSAREANSPVLPF